MLPNLAWDFVFVELYWDTIAVAKATLLVIQGVDQGTRFEVSAGEVGIGRGIVNEVRILDTEISRLHAKLKCDGEHFVLTDRNSSNGTFVNGVAIDSQTLQDGDHLQLGCTTILFSEVVDRDINKHVAKKVDLLDQSAMVDGSSIVSQVSQRSGQELLKQAVDAEESDAAQTLANLQALYRISEESVSPSISLDQMLNRILDLTLHTVGADRGCMLVSDIQTGELKTRVIRHKHGVDSSAVMTVSLSIVDYVLKNEQGVLTSDARSDQRFSAAPSIVQAGIREAMCVPMQGRYQLVGVMYLDTTTPPERLILEGEYVNKFNEDQLRLLVAIGRQSALAVEDHRYQQAFVKAERLAAVGQTIATLSHHIKNILQGVRGGSYLIDMGLKDQDSELIGKGWKIVEKNQNKIYDLVMDMLTYSTERRPAWQKSSLNETVTDVCELMQARAKECKVMLSCHLEPRLPESTFDPEGIHRAALNIVTNAIDAIEGMESGAVKVQTGYDRDAESVFIEVSDNGLGIPSDQVSRIFNVFESTKGARGTGLGLAVSQKIIREHGGEITVVSESGQGCLFRLAWPLMDSEPEIAEDETIV